MAGHGSNPGWEFQWSMRSAMAAAAPGTCQERSASRIAVRRAGSPSRARISCVNNSGESVSAGAAQAAPPQVKASAL